MDEALKREVEHALGGLADNLERATCQGHPLAVYGRKLAERVRDAPARAPAPAPAGAAVPVDGLARSVREYFTTTSFPHRALAGYDIEDLLGTGDAEERAQRRPGLEKRCAEVDAIRERTRRRTGT